MSCVGFLLLKVLPDGRPDRLVAIGIDALLYKQVDFFELRIREPDWDPLHLWTHTNLYSISVFIVYYIDTN